MKTCICTFLLLTGLFAHAQVPTQTLKGRVFDRDSKQLLAGATISVIDLESPLGAISDSNGVFKISNIPIGRHTVRCSFIGYEPFESPGIILNSVKETVIDIELSENSITTNTVLLTAIKDGNEPVNDVAVVSARSFSPEETGRYAASVNDPGRMALAFPGVQQGRDDGENDVIIRGNSSVGMLWRLEGIDIPNPNHFARPGTSGGGITVFSAQLLGQSDFFSGALPAEYGNALSGAMDVHFRKGNRTEREYRAKIGLLGLDFMAEGPIKKGKSSYLANYRYSTLGLLSNLGFYLVGERVTNNFQDLSFNLAFDGKNGKDFVTVFGIGGLSEEYYQPVADPMERDTGIANHWEDRVRTSNMAATGITYTRLLDDKSYLKAVIAVMGSQIKYVSDTLDLTDTRFRYNFEEYKDGRIATSLTYNRKLSTRTKFKTGLHFNQVFFDYFREDHPRASSSNLDPNRPVGVSIDGSGNTQTVQYYAQLSHHLSDRLTGHIGVHGLGLLLNNSFAADPRLALKFQINKRHRLSLGTGLHSQMLPLGTYFYTDSTGNMPNRELPFMGSIHIIAGHKMLLPSRMSIGTEVYVQRLFNVPTRLNDDQDYWMLNQQQGFPTFDLVSQSIGTNMGVDLSVEKYFSKGLFFLFTGSLFESNYLTTTSGGTRSSKFNTRFISSYTLAKEFNFKKGRVLQLGTKTLFNGGFRYTPHDPVLSAQENRYVPLAGAAWSEQVPNFFRIDARISYRVNRPKLATILSLDVQNVANRANMRSVGYNAVTNELVFQKHPSGLIPVLSWQADF